MYCKILLELYLKDNNIPEYSAGNFYFYYQVQEIAKATSFRDIFFVSSLSSTKIPVKCSAKATFRRGD